MRARLFMHFSKKLIPIVMKTIPCPRQEIRFGDNDRLASRVAQMIGADLVIQLSTIDGMYTADPRIDPTATHIPVIEVERRLCGDGRRRPPRCIDRWHEEQSGSRTYSHRVRRAYDHR